MSDGRVPIDWLIPVTEWRLFRTFVKTEFGDYNGALGHRVDAAMREYIDFDTDLAVLEQVLDEALSKRGLEEEKQKSTVGIASLANAEKRRVQVCVDPDVLVAFKKWVDENSDDSYGVELARALRQYRTNPRSSRLRSKFERYSSSKKASASAYHHDTEDESPSVPTGEVEADSDRATEESDTLNRRTEKTIEALQGSHPDVETILRNGGKIPTRWIDEAIVDGAGCTSKPAIKKYRKRVANELGIVRHPHYPELWVHQDYCPDCPDHKPWECWVPVPVLKGDPEARAYRVCCEAGRRAVEKGGIIRLSVDEVHKEILDSEVSTKTTRDTMKKVAEIGGGGFKRTTSHGAKKRLLKVDLGALREDEPDLYNEIVQYYNGETGSEDE
ncbi:hypothetical protein ACFQO4_13630 [Saliphagus sp. GCM10025334]